MGNIKLLGAFLALLLIGLMMMSIWYAERREAAGYARAKTEVNELIKVKEQTDDKITQASVEVNKRFNEVNSSNNSCADYYSSLVPAECLLD